MPSWTHLIRFIANEDSQVHLGQLVDTSIDAGKATYEGKKVEAYEVTGSVFDGEVTNNVLTVKEVSTYQKLTNVLSTYQLHQLLSPIDRLQCSYIRCIGLNYKDHAAESNLALPTEPILFTKPRTSLTGPFPAPIPIPKIAQDGTSDYEAELCVVIGKDGKDIAEKDALDYVLGFTASNDVSARKLQLATSQWCFGKGLDGACPIGQFSFSKSHKTYTQWFQNRTNTSITVCDKGSANATN
jgi:2-keto-4-pentenoate hydratase/2-oxohepta-3-ene-1,7-dioic acid hydratase in catechol pathway